jgi:hypothetical protein
MAWFGLGPVWFPSSNQVQVQLSPAAWHNYPAFPSLYVEMHATPNSPVYMQRHLLFTDDNFAGNATWRGLFPQHITRQYVKKRSKVFE